MNAKEPGSFIASTYWKDPVHHIIRAANSPFPAMIAIGIACFSITIILMTVQLVKLKRTNRKWDS